MTKLEKLIFDAMLGVVGERQTEKIAAAVLPLIEEAFDNGLDRGVEIGTPYLREFKAPSRNQWLSENITCPADKQNEMITELEYKKLKQQHEEACRKNDYSKMIMIGSPDEAKMKEYEREHVCKHTSIEEIQGGQIEICRQCGKTWG